MEFMRHAQDFARGGDILNLEIQSILCDFDESPELGKN